MAIGAHVSSYTFHCAYKGSSPAASMSIASSNAKRGRLLLDEPSPVSSGMPPRTRPRRCNAVVLQGVIISQQLLPYEHEALMRRVDACSCCYLVPYMAHQRVPRLQADRDGFGPRVDENTAAPSCLQLPLVRGRRCVNVVVHSPRLGPLVVPGSPTPTVGRPRCCAATPTTALGIPPNSRGGAAPGTVRGRDGLAVHLTLTSLIRLHAASWRTMPAVPARVGILGVLGVLIRARICDAVCAHVALECAPRSP